MLQPTLTIGGEWIPVGRDESLYTEHIGNRRRQSIIFLQGLSAASHTIWDPLFESNLASHFHLVRFDARGQGISSKPWVFGEVAYDDRMLASDIDDVMTHFHVCRPILCGWGLAGIEMCWN